MISQPSGVSCNPQDQTTPESEAVELSFAAERKAAAGAATGRWAGEAAVPSYRSAAERLTLVWPDEPLIVDALVLAGFDVIGFAPVQEPWT